MSDIDSTRRKLFTALLTLPLWPIVGSTLADGGLLAGVHESARHLGAAYLHEHPEDASAEVLARHLAPLAASPATLAATAAAEFRCGRMVQVQRCWLALSEARACALVALGGRV